MNDRDFLRQAIEIGNQIDTPYNFGAVVVVDDNVISAEHNHVHELNNPSLHAEVSAITKACEILGKYHLEGATLYSSHEPCVMCFSCAAWAHFDRIVYVTPASVQENFMYELKSTNIIELSKNLVRPMIVEQISVN
jgi:tRNA(Arg) A34 adenosine deaminase TadA